MGKLEELTKIVADMFEQATDKADIDRLTAIKTNLDGAVEEQKALEQKNAELIKSYKDLVHHSSFNDTVTKPTDPVGGTPVSFEDCLAQFIAKNK